MSHFTVIVAGDDVDAALAPFDEDISVEPYLASVEGEWKEAVQTAREWVDQQPTDRRDWTDQDYLDAYYNEGEWKPARDGEGFERWSTYNPQAHWDWYVVGGRWENTLPTRYGGRVNECVAGDLDLDLLETPHALLVDGEWTEQGRMGWFGIVVSPVDEDAWAKQVTAALSSLPLQTKLTLVDCHI